MGVMRFIVHPPASDPAWDGGSEAFVRGIDGRVFPTTVDFEDGQMCCRRSLSDSGTVSLPWPVSGFGTPVLTTTSLRERTEPYLLSLELARGILSQVRDQWAAWEMARMVVPDTFKDIQREAFRAFARASSSQNDAEAASKLAQQSIELASQASEILADTYVVQRMMSIRKSTRHAPSLLGCTLDKSALDTVGASSFLSCFNTASVPIHWLDIEPTEGNYNWDPVDQLVDFCSEHRLIARGGPLIDLADHGLPTWLAPWKDDFFNLPSFVCDFVETAINKYTGLIRIWEVSTAGNIGAALGLSEEHRLAMVAKTLETAIRTDSDSQFFIRIQQPWGGYQRNGNHQLSPFQFVDALVRSNIGLTGISLDINVGYHNPGCLPRDMLTISKLIDWWSMLSVQIHVNLVCPSHSKTDALADPYIQVNDNAWKSHWTEESQADWYERVVPLLMAKPSVTGVFLEQFSDGVPHRFPHGGVLNVSGEPKSVHETLRRQLHFKVR